MRELISYAVALVLYGFGLGVLQVPNPKRIIASRVLLVLGAVSASGASFMWLTSASDRLWGRALLSILVFGLIGWATVEAIRFAGHTEPLAASPASSPLPPAHPQPTLAQPPAANTPEVSQKQANDRPRSQLKARSKSQAAPAINQTMTNSAGAIQAGRDVTVGQKPSPTATEKDKKP